MRKIILTTISLFFALTIFGQTAYEPQILILSTNEMTYNKIFYKEISTYNDEAKKAQKQDNLEELSGKLVNQPENIRLIMQNEIAFCKTLDFSKQISLIAEQYLIYLFIQKFPNLLIILKDIKCSGNASDLKKNAEEHQLQYVLNFSKINFYKEDGISKAKVSVQLYDQISNSFLLYKDYIGDWHNPGFEFSCQDSTLDCTINNALSQILSDVVEVVAENSPTLQAERQLAQERFNVLINDYYSKPFDKTFVSKIILPLDNNINVSSLYQCLFDESKTKFIAFFLNEADSTDFKSLKDDRKDKNVNIILSKDIKSPDFLDEMPQTYAYIVKGVKYQDKWYCQKSGVTYFESESIQDGQQRFFNHLQDWGFFKNNSTDFNSDFWETNQFEKVKDLTKDPEWNQYGATIWESEERENRDYIGMYEIVADELKRLKEEEKKKFDSTFYNNVFIPFYDEQVKNDPVNFAQYSMLNKEPILIYPKERNIILTPIMITDSSNKKTLHFYFTFVDSNVIYEWTYFQPKILPEKSWHYGKTIVDQLETITEWNFTNETLDDKDFWNKYVLPKSGEKFVYLKRVK